MNSNFLRTIFRLFVVAAIVAITALVTGCAKEAHKVSNQQAIQQENKVNVQLAEIKEDPLFVINGKVVEIIPGAKTIRSSVWRIVQPGDISTIEILKGTAAIDQWGAQGTHGVVLITTTGKTKMDID
jgi:hypothetical protein